jgi:hypothetical protein
MRRLFSFIFFLALLSSLAFAAPPFPETVVSNPVNELSIAYPLNYYYEQNKNISFNFDILDSNLTRLTNLTTNCTIYIANYVGALEYKSNLTYSTVYNSWNYIYYTDDIGVHSFYLYCSSANGQRGYIVQSFETTSNGYEPVRDGSFNISIVVIIIFVFLVYLFSVYSLREENFTQHGLIKFSIIVLTVWALLIPLNIAIEINENSNGPQDVSSMLTLLYQIIVWVNYGFTFYMLLFMIIVFINMLQGKREKNGEE